MGSWIFFFSYNATHFVNNQNSNNNNKNNNEATAEHYV